MAAAAHPSWLLRAPAHSHRMHPAVPAPRSAPPADTEPRSGPDATAPVRIAAPSLVGVVRIVGIVVACAAALYLLWRLRGVVRIAAVALFLALALNPVVDALDRRTRAPRGAAILAVYVVLAAAVLGIGAGVVPAMVGQVQQLAHEAPRYVDDVRRDPTLRRYDDRYHITANLQADARALPGRLARASGSLQGVTVRAFAAVSDFVTVLALAFLFMLQGRRYVDMALRLTGPREERWRSVIGDVNRAVARYTLGNIAISGLATAATWLVLTILGVPYALALGVLVGVFDLIPLVGASIGAAIVAVATATVAFPIATVVWLVFIVLYQRVENYLVQPLVYGQALDINPVVTILAVLAGASLQGILGALLAIPVAAAIQIVARDWWTNRTARLGARNDHPA